MSSASHPIDRLAATIAARAAASDADSSYTARLLAAGTPRIARKVGEEAVETVVAALGETDERLIEESADLVYHLLVLLRARGVEPGALWAELERRSSPSG